MVDHFSLHAMARKSPPETMDAVRRLFRDQSWVLKLTTLSASVTPRAENSAGSAHSLHGGKRLLYSQVCEG